MPTIPILGKKGGVLIDGAPDYCPLCRHAVEPKLTNVAIQTDDYSNPIVEVVFLCPRNKCGRLYIGRYALQHRFSGDETFRLFECVPFTLQEPTFSKSVVELSPSFTGIYKEARFAEAYGLRLVCGPGYRKSLEFLVKDYLCTLNPNEADKIKAMALGACINDYAKDARVRSMAARAAWLGNDETHYVRKWEDKDLEDLKKLIALTLNWIEAEELTKDAIADMPEGKK